MNQFESSLIKVYFQLAPNSSGICLPHKHLLFGRRCCLHCKYWGVLEKRRCCLHIFIWNMLSVVK